MPNKIMLPKAFSNRFKMHAVENYEPEQSGAGVLALVQVVVHQVQLGKCDQGHLVIRVELETILFDMTFIPKSLTVLLLSQEIIVSKTVQLFGIVNETWSASL